MRGITSTRKIPPSHIVWISHLTLDRNGIRPRRLYIPTAPAPPFVVISKACRNPTFICQNVPYRKDMRELYHPPSTARPTSAPFILYRLPALHRLNGCFVKGVPDGIFQGLCNTPWTSAIQRLGPEYHPILLVPMSSLALKTRLQSFFAFSVPLTTSCPHLPFNT